jgi:tetratricopeptide (TPR) repeat protein
VLGEDHRYTLSSAYVLALAFVSSERYDDAEESLRVNLEKQRRTLGDEHPDTLDSMNLLAETYGKLGRYEEAEAFHRETLATRSRVLGKEHLFTQWSMYHLATILREQRRYEEAGELYRETLSIELRVLGEDHAETLDTLYQLACNEALRGNRDQAISFLRRAVEHGWHDAEAAETDTNIDSLRGGSEFEALMAEVRTRSRSSNQ